MGRDVTQPGFAVVAAALLIGSACTRPPSCAYAPDGGWSGSSGTAAGYASWTRDAVFYHVYVRSFLDSNGDGMGDLAGLTSKLAYIQSLGVDGILLLPIQQNDHDEYGGYATTDYGHVEVDYGGDAAWDSFIAAAHGRGLKVLLDLSLTHVSDTHPWFLAASRDICAAERSHFMWQGPPCPSGPNNAFGVASAWTAAPIGPCYYGSYSPLPNLNVRDPATAEYLFSVATQWLSRGADGFRLDSTPAIGEWDPASPTTKNGSSPLTHAFWKTFMQRTKSASAQSVAVAEVFTSDATQLTPFFADGIDLAFDYPVWLGGLYDAFKNGGKAGISTMVSASLAARPAGAAGAIFLDNHDVPGSMSYLSPNGRVADLLGGDPMRLQSAAVLLFGLPSVPFVYYGDEIGLRGAAPAPGATPWSRNPMQWDSSANRGFTTSTPWVPVSADATANVADEEAASTSLLKTYRGLISVRKTSPALMHGDYREIPSPSGAVYAFLRESASPSERVVVLVNFAGSAASTTLDFQALGITSASLCDRLCGNPCNSCALPAAITPSNASAYPIDSSVLAAYGARWLLIQ